MCKGQSQAQKDRQYNSHKMQNKKDRVSDADLSLCFPLQAAELHFLVLPKPKLKTACGVPVSGVKA